MINLSKHGRYAMKKVILCLVIISVLFMSATSYAIDNIDLKKPLGKLGRGLANVFTCPLEIAKTIGDTNYEKGPIAAITAGFVQGIYKTGVRAAVGAFEVVTFLFPFPGDYDPVLTDPEFFLSEGLF
jgi:putative exosortase-associated protein (TIGR04073 family)